MGAPSRRARKIRRGSQFDLARLSTELRKPRDNNSILYSWSLEQIFLARDEQTIGTFVLPARMAESMLVDDAIYAAYENRLAPQRCIPVKMEPAKGARGAGICGEAEALFGQRGVGISPETLRDIHGCLVQHGVAFAVNVATPRDNGSRVDMQVRYFPIEYIWFNPIVRCFMARCDPNSITEGDQIKTDGIGWLGGVWVPIIHGDGRWIMFSQNEITPYRYGCVLPASLVWARHAFAARDWAKGSVAHGHAKVVGQLPEGIALQDSVTGALTPEAAAYMTALQAIGSADAPAVITPAGSNTDFITNNSTAWQVWSELVNNAEKAAARIYLGTDGTLGTQENAPGVDITALFGVASTIVRGDLECIERSLQTGLIEPWCAINFGDSSLAPYRKYQVPNEDEDKVKAEEGKRATVFWGALKLAKDAGVVVNQEYVTKLAVALGTCAPTLTQPPVVAPPKPAATADGTEKVETPSADPPARTPSP